MTHSMFDADGGLLKSLLYSYTYGDPAKGEIPDTLYKYEIGSGIDFTFVYDDLARLTHRNLITDSINKTESYTYKVSDRGTNWTTPLVQSMTDFAGVQHVYTYDANGNILSDTYGGYTVSYKYDSLNRMTRYNDPVYGWTCVYVYDNRGNITEMQEYEYTTAETLGEPLYTYEYEYGNSTWADLLTSYYGADISYDELGNPTKWINGETLEWQNGRQLASYDDSVNYTYNADGLRTGKSGDRNTEYYIVNGTYLGETTTINGTAYNLYYFYDENGSPAGLWQGSTVYYFAKNLQGDVTSILDAQGNVVANYRYDAYGSIISVTDASGNYISSATHIANLNPFRYRGYMYDEESGFYYLRSRYYDPYIGRFLNADGLVSTGQGLDGNNMFAYCGNNPVMRVDTSGKWFEIVVGIIAVVAALLTTTSCSKKEPEPLPYESADDAAKAFSEEIYDTSRYIRHEYGTVIYSSTSNGKTTYNYTEPLLGHPHDVSHPLDIPDGTTAVATAHTHIFGNGFSGTMRGATEGDIPNAKKMNLNAYVVGPSLNLMRYDVSTNEFDYAVCKISPKSLTPGEKNKLALLFQTAWDEHISEPCEFGCENIIWPTP